MPLRPRAVEQISILAGWELLKMSLDVTLRVAFHGVFPPFRTAPLGFGAMPPAHSVISSTDSPDGMQRLHERYTVLLRSQFFGIGAVEIFTKDSHGAVHHFYSAHPWMSPEVKERGIDLLSPIWHVLDLTPQGRGDWYA